MSATPGLKLVELGDVALGHELIGHRVREVEDPGLHSLDGRGEEPAASIGVRDDIHHAQSLDARRYLGVPRPE